MSGTEWLSQGVETLLTEIEKRPASAAADPIFDIVIVGSGYGGAVAAARFAGSREMAAGRERPLRVAVLERGKEFVAGDFPAHFADLPGQVRVNLNDDPRPKGNRDGLFDLRQGKDVSAILGNGLGGGSLINAGVLARPQPWIFKDDWPASITCAELEPDFLEVENRLGASQTPAPPQKFEALAAVGRCMSPPRIAERASIAVSFFPRTDHESGIEHHECIGCGDCFTGCNHAAKNTLAMNYLPLARRRGAEIFTGVTVHSLSRSNGAWEIWLMPTDAVTAKRIAEKHLARLEKTADGKALSENIPLKEEHYLVPLRARRVILAAGTFGSTEILLRSRDKRGLVVSEEIGKRFSANGDMISVAYGMRQRVNGSSRENTSPACRQVGATITGMIDLRDGKKSGLVIEEMAVPASLRRAFEEIVTNTALLHGLTQCDRSVHDGDALARDPVAIDPDAIAHTAIYASMGHDGSAGKLEPVLPQPHPAPSAMVSQDEPQPDEGNLAVKWSHVGDEAVFARGIEALQTAHGNAEVGGIVIPLPMWRPVPDSLGDMLDTGNGSVVTAHPLGGCPMGNNFTDGVVNDLGQVFDGVSGTHEGLVILDGSIVPTSLGVNPCLTIAALAEHAARGLAMQWNLDTFDYANGYCPNAVFNLQHLPPQPVVAATEPPGRPLPTSLRLAEKLVTTSFALPPGRIGTENRYEASIEIECAPIDDLESFLAVHPKTLHFAHATLNLIPINSAGSKLEPIVVPLEGSMTLLERENSTSCGRVLRASIAWLCNRGWHDLWQTAARCLSGERQNSSKGKQSALRSFIALASHLGEARLFRYTFIPRADTIAGSHTLILASDRLVGSKRIAYVHKANLWRQLTELELSWAPNTDGPRRSAGKFTVDLPYFVTEHAFQYQLVQQQNQPAAMADLFSFITWIVRTAGKIHLWSFRAPDYPPDYESGEWDLNYKSVPDDESGTFWGCDSRLPGEISGLHRKRFAVDVQAERSVVEKIKRDPIRIRAEKILLTRYQESPEGQPSKENPVLLIHGYGASGTTFTLDTISENLVQHLSKGNRQVWVVDLRTSIGLQGSERQWTFEDVACMDIPTAIHEVLRRTGVGKIDVVAHCIGSAMFCMSALGGFLRGFIRRGFIRAGTGSVEPMNLDEHINAVVLMQVGPIIKFPPMNHARGYVAGYVKNMLQWQNFNVTEPLRPFVRLLDRLLSLYPNPSYEWNAHHLPWPCSRAEDEAFCNRTSAIFGRLYEHDNLNHETLANIRNLLGHVNVKTFEQTIFFAKKGRLADCFGQSPYVNFRTITKFFRFPVCMIHGARNEVFHWQGGQRSIELLESAFKNALPTQAASDSTAELPHADPSQGRKPALLPFPLKQVSERYEFLPMLNYGHQDCLIGERAHSDVFPNISRFLQKQARAARPVEVDSDSYVVRTPRLGPILGWLRAANQKVDRGKVANISFVPDDQYSPPLFAITIVIKRSTQSKAEPVSGHAAIHRLAEVDSTLLPHRTQQSAFANLAVPILTPAIRVVQTIAVCLPTEIKDYRVVVLTVHAEPVGFGINQKPEGRGWLVNTDDDISRLLDEAAHDGEILPDAVASRILECCDDDDVHFRTIPPQPRVVDAGYERTSCVAFISDGCLRSAGPASASGKNQVDNGDVLAEFAFAVGSCRYTSTIFDRELTDRRFGGLLDLVRGNHPGRPDPRLLLLVGDQIYADSTAGLFDPGSDFERYDAHYAEAWSAPYARDVLRHLPTYMMLDDHELEENAEPEQFENIQRSALGAFEAYQRRLAPPNPVAKTHPDGSYSRGAYWYCFAAGGYGFFVMDTRTDRVRDSGMECLADEIIQEAQAKYLQGWLLEQKRIAPDQPKFVVSPSVVLPFLSSTRGSPSYAIRSDSWDGFPQSLYQLLKFIAHEGIENVVFLSGDFHCSLACELTLHEPGHETDAVKAYSIVSSGFYAPYPFANTRARELELNFRGTIANRMGEGMPIGHFDDLVIDYKTKGEIITEDSFAVVSIQPSQNAGSVLRVEFDGASRVVGLDFDL